MTSSRAIRPIGALLALASLLLAGPAGAQFWRQREHAAPPADVKPVALEEVRVEEKLGAQLPLDDPFTDWRGRPFTLRQALDGRKPLVVAMVYYDCPMLCGLILTGLAKGMRQNGLELGKDFQAVTVSFDPAERPGLAAERRRGYLQSVGLADAGEDWPFLVGAEESSRRLSEALGFYYKYDQVSGEWAHMAAVFVAHPGRPHLPLPLRHRVPAQGPPAGAGGGRRRAGGHQLRPAPAHLLPVRPGHAEVPALRVRHRARGRAPHPGRPRPPHRAPDLA